MLLNIGEFDSLELSNYLTSYNEINRYRCRYTLSTSKSHRVSKGEDGREIEISGEF